MDDDNDQELNHGFCCDAFAKEATSSRPKGAAAFLTKSGGHSTQIEFSEESRSWDVKGCCGACYVLNDLKYCPFCGSELEGGA